MTLRRLILFIVTINLAFVLSTVSIYGQCNFACNDTINISVDRDCRIFVTPDMVLDGSNAACNGAKINVINSNNQSIGSLITERYVGQTLRVDINLGSNRCSSYIKVEDKLPPEIVCPPNDTLQCDENDYAETNASLETYLENLLESTIIDNCGNEEITVEIIQNNLNQLCVDPYASVRNITFNALDNQANATTCSFDIYYEAIPPDSVDAPKNFTGTMALDCTDNFPLVDGTPYPSVEYLLQRFGEITVPNIGGDALADLIDGIFVSDNLCNFMITYTDQVFPSCGGSYKIVRSWVVQDWCSINPPATFHQVIKVEDDELDITNGPSSATIDASGSSCEATLALTIPTVATDECSDWTWSVSVKAEGETEYTTIRSDIQSFINSISYTFSFGLNMVKYTVVDECDNMDEWDFNVTVRDNDEPMAVCDLRTVVTLNEDFNAKVFARSFDDLSFDVCSDITYQVRRKDGGCSSTSSFGDFVKFCCEDFGKVIMVELRITDENGLSSTCWAEAVIQFKGDVLDINCPTNPDTFDCRLFEGFNLGSLTVPTISTRSSCIGPFTPIPMVVDESIDECGDGFKDVEWTIDYNGADTVICTQRLSFFNTDPFDEMDITWPSNKTISSCDDLAPTQSELDNIVGNNVGCSNVIYSEPQDRVFQNLSSACVKVLRTWTVVDWCRYPQNPNAIWTHVQTIIVSQSEDPEFATTVASIDRRPSALGCNEEVTITPMATDDCTPDDELIWTYRLGLVSGNSSIDIIPETPGDVIITSLELGSYRATWTVTDHCGNTTTGAYDFEINDDEDPVALCASDISVDISTLTERAVLNVDMVDDGSTENCTDLIRGLRIAGTDDMPSENIVFTCDDIGEVNIELVVEDENGNSDNCFVTISVEDPNNICFPGFNNIGLPCGNVMDFDGVDDFIEVSSLSAPRNFTIEAVLFYRGSDDGYVTLFEFGDDNPFIGFDEGRLSIFGEIFTDEQFPRESWIHVAFTYSPDDNRSTIYINGDIAKEGAASRVFSGAGFGIGHLSSDLFYDGQMDEVRVWDIERTQEDIIATINDNLTGSEPNLIAYYNFDAIGGLALDASDNSHHGALMGTLGSNRGPRFEQVNNICTGDFIGSSTIALGGTVYTTADIAIEDVQMSAQNTIDADMSYSETDVAGQYAFDNLPGYAQYKLSPTKVDDFTNGVTTLDLILIQMHILGIQSLDSPYKLIAADVNSNGSISSIDMVQLRQLILGITDELPNNDSWRFIDREYDFIDPTSPWRFDEQKQVNVQNNNLENNDFVGVKIGDVNGSAVANSALAGARNIENYEIQLSEIFDNGDLYTDIIASEDISLSGLQLKLHLRDNIGFALKNGLIRLSADNYYINNNILTISWDGSNELIVPAGTKLFSVLGAIETDQSKTFNQIYDSHYDTKLVSFNRISGDEHVEFDLTVDQNQPNPFTDETTIFFYISEDSEVEIEVFTMSGQSIYQESKLYSRGNHQIILQTDKVGLNKGIHYYQIKTQKRSLVRKMIVI